MDPSSTSVPIDRVVATDELARRPFRPADHEAESRALVSLAQQMASFPREILQHLVDTALQLCRADSAGLSLIETDAGRQIFRWHAVAGTFAPHVFGTTPREFSPCGTVVDRNAVMLFSRPARHFGYLNDVPTAIEEALLVPFAVSGEPFGTIWVMSTSEQCRFDAEDARILTSLGTFASAAYQILGSLETIRAADRNKTEFLAMLGHELRNPLAPISTSLGVLRYAGEKSPAVLSVAEMIGRQLAQLVRLVDDLLDVSRIGQGKIELRWERCDLGSAVKQAVETVGPIVESRNHELVLSLPDSPVYTYGDPIRLAQVVGNLLNNACKFSEKNSQVRLSLAREEEHAVIRVRDEGLGIAPDQLGQVFAMFTQLNERDHSRGGLGVGLSLVKGLVEMHGGTVTAHSVGLGRGSEFVVRLAVSP